VRLKETDMPEEAEPSAANAKTRTLVAMPLIKIIRQLAAPVVIDA
jgi:hypothetical protein